MQDPTYDFALTNQGKPIDIYDVLLTLRAGEADRLSIDTGSTFVSREVLVHANEVDNVEKNPDFYVSQIPDSRTEDKLVFASAEKWTDVGSTPTGRRLADYMEATFGLPNDPIYALLMVKNMPTTELWEKAEAIKLEMLAEAGQPLP